MVWYRLKFIFCVWISNCSSILERLSFLHIFLFTIFGVFVFVFGGVVWFFPVYYWWKDRLLYFSFFKNQLSIYRTSLFMDSTLTHWSSCLSWCQYHTIDYGSFTIILKIKSCLFSNFVLFKNQSCSGYSKIFAFPEELLNQFPNFYKKTLLGFWLILYWIYVLIWKWWAS